MSVFNSPRAISSLDARPLYYRDRRNGTVGRFRECRRRTGHSTHDRNQQRLITVAKEHRFEPRDGAASYWVSQPEFTRNFSEEPR